MALRRGSPVSPEDLRTGMEAMCKCLEEGFRVVIGSDAAMPDGASIGDDIGPYKWSLRVKCRSTRAEYLACAVAVTDANNSSRFLQEVREFRARFYYELEIFHLVVPGPDGDLFGLRWEFRGPGDPEHPKKGRPN